VILFIMVSTLSAQSVTYYLDSASGSDTSRGTSPASAWQSLTKVNGKAFQPGDSILFKSGSVWTGQLIPKGSGAEGKPIVVGKYGVGVKPRIDGNGVTGQGTVYLFNAEYWEITNLEITNDALTAGDRRGVLVAAADFGLVHHIHLKDLDIHDVKGIVGNEDPEKRTAGIGIETTTDKVLATRFDDILIEGCTISAIENTGIYTDNLLGRSVPGTDDWTRRRFTNVRIRKNVIHHISKNAMIIRLLDGGLVERTVCYETALRTTGNTMFTSSCNGTVFQYNEGYYNRATENTPGGADGSMYDADLKSSNVVFQYSYSHDNSHGLFWSCTVQNDSNVICRYNISRNDKGIIFCVNYPVTSTYIYNNTVYCGSGLSPIIISERNVMSGTRKYTFSNNIIYNASSGASYDFRASGYTRIIDYNVFYNAPGSPRPSNEPTTPNGLASDPKLVDPASGGIGLTTLDGFKLQAGSPCVNTGIQFQGHSALDFWGNSVPSGGTVDRGAYEFTSGSTGVNGNGSSHPSQFVLMQNYPNPFNPQTAISYQLLAPSGAEGSAVSGVNLKVFDLLGREVTTLVDKAQRPGTHRVAWNATDSRGNPVPSGVYFYRLTTADGSLEKKMLLVR
jgi:hypothetical protein